MPFRHSHLQRNKSVISKDLNYIANSLRSLLRITIAPEIVSVIAMF